jgi:hypothetical protein
MKWVAGLSIEGATALSCLPDAVRFTASSWPIAVVIEV